MITYHAVTAKGLHDGPLGRLAPWNRTIGTACQLHQAQHQCKIIG
jgi:hypothetical protein